MTEHEVIALRSVLAELLLELSGRLGLDVADRRAKAISHPEQTLICASVPGLVADRSRCQQRDAKGSISGARLSDVKRALVRASVRPRCTTRRPEARKLSRRRCGACGKMWKISVYGSRFVELSAVATVP